MMDKSVEVIPYFERGGVRPEDWPEDNYVAGFRKADGTPSGVQVILPADIVEHTVLAHSQLSLMMNPDGSLALRSEELSDDAVEVANRCGIGRQSLESLLKECLRPDAVAMDEDATEDLRLLRTQLAAGLALVERTLDELAKKG